MEFDDQSHLKLNSNSYLNEIMLLISANKWVFCLSLKLMWSFSDLRDLVCQDPKRFSDDSIEDLEWLDRLFNISLVN